jgi:hypothetical protein
MRRTFCLLLALLVVAPAAFAQSYSGTYVAQNPTGAVTLSIKQDAQGKIAGTLSGNGATFEVQAQTSPQGIYGSVTGNGAQLFILAERAGKDLRVLLAEPGPNGQPNLNAARQLLMTRTKAAGSPAAKAAPAAPAAPAGAGGQDAQVSQFLTANAWCAFSYNKNTGTSRKERVVFRHDGIVVQQTGGETYSSGAAGTVAGQHTGGNQGRWRARNGTLELSQDGVNWAPQQLNVTRNSNGYPIINAGGKEYMQCS